jgi:hypothetical protein
MRVREAADMLTALADEYPDYRLSVYANGQHHTTKLLFYAIAPSVPGPYKYHSKEDIKAFAELTREEKMAVIRDLLGEI